MIFFISQVFLYLKFSDPNEASFLLENKWSQLPLTFLPLSMASLLSCLCKIKICYFNISLKIWLFLFYTYPSSLEVTYSLEVVSNVLVLGSNVVVPKLVVVSGSFVVVAATGVVSVLLLFYLQRIK